MAIRIKESEYKLMKAIQRGELPELKYAEDCWELAWLIQEGFVSVNEEVLTYQELYKWGHDLAKCGQNSPKKGGKEGGKDNDKNLKLPVLLAVGGLFLAVTCGVLVLL